MRASLTAPALAAWLIAAVTISIVWHAPWYVSAVGGLVIAVLVYFIWIAIKPRLNWIPEWSMDFIASFGWFALGLSWLSQSGWLYGALGFLNAALSLLSAARSFIHRNEPLEAD